MKSKVLLGLGALVVAGAGYATLTGAFFTSTAFATGNVFKAGTLDLRIANNNSSDEPSTYGTSRTSVWDFSSMAPGDAPSVDKAWLKNYGSVDGMHVGISASSTPTSGPDLAPQVRITELTLGGEDLLVGGLINGADPNGNGYADLEDLETDPLVNAAVSLNAGEEKQLVMAVQLDGPTTDNSFQGAGLSTDLTFALSQQ